MDLGARCPPEKDFESWAAYLEAWDLMELRHLRYFVAVARCFNPDVEKFAAPVRSNRPSI